MSRAVRFSPDAELDLDRLSDFLAAVAPAAAVRAANEIRSGILSLRNFPEQGARVNGTLRQLIIPFGDSGYVVQYRVDPETIVVARIFHMREDRSRGG